MKLKFFNDVPAVISYVTSELTSTLEDDARTCEQDDRDTARDLRAKIGDIKKVTPLIEAAPDMLAILADAITAFEGEEGSVQEEHRDLIVKMNRVYKAAVKS